MDHPSSLDLHCSRDPNSEESADSDDYVPYSERRCFHIVNHYLHGGEKTDMAETSRRILEMMPTRDQYYYGRSGVPSLLVGLICDIAQQIPYFHPFQVKLLALVEKLSHNPMLYSVRESMGIALHEYDNDDFEVSVANPEPYIGCVNLNAFKARLYAAHVWSSRDSGSAYLRDMLEEPSHPDLEAESAQLRAVAMWVIYAGDRLFQDVVESSRDGDGLAPGILYQKYGLNEKRWQFWANVLETRAEDMKTGSKSEELANTAASFMHAKLLLRESRRMDAAFLAESRRGGWNSIMHSFMN